MAQSGSLRSNPDANQLLVEKEDLENTIRRQQAALEEKTSEIENLEAALLAEKKRWSEEETRIAESRASDAERIVFLERELERVKQLSQTGRVGPQLNETKTEANPTTTHALETVSKDPKRSEPVQPISSEKPVDPNVSVTGLLKDKKTGSQAPQVLSKVEEKLASSAMSLLQKGLGLPSAAITSSDKQTVGNQSEVTKEPSRQTGIGQSDPVPNENNEIKNTRIATNVDELLAEI